MRVALDVSAVPRQPAGAGIYVLELARALAAGTDVDLQLVARSDDAARWRPLGRPVHPRAPVRRPVRLAWEQAMGPRLARSLDADVWHGPHYTMPSRLPVPAVVTIHDLTFFDHPQLHERSKVLVFRRMIRMAARRARVLVCVSARTRDRLLELLSPTGDVVVAPHGVSFDRFGPAGDLTADAARLARLGVTAPFVAFVGTVEPRKNVDGLVRALDRLDRPDVQLVVAGQPGWGEDELSRAVQESSLGERFVRLGYVDEADVPALYRRAAAVAYPAYDEGFGLPVLEALACGAAVVTTAGTPMADVAGDAALLVPPGDDEALSQSLNALLAGGPDVDRLRAAGPAAARPFSWDACARAHVDAYRLATG